MIGHRVAQARRQADGLDDWMRQQLARVRNSRMVLARSAERKYRRQVECELRPEDLESGGEAVRVEVRR